MKDISHREILERFTAVDGKLGHLKTKKGRRRCSWEFDLQSVGDSFVRDSSVILLSKAFRRMPFKNQVASSIDQVYVRNRNSHTAEVVGISSSLASILGLNSDLTTAIGWGHDIGHVPFGHQGEKYIRDKIGVPFSHEVMGVVILQNIERGGCGVNCTHETLEGIHGHSGNNATAEMTQEAWVVRFCDKVAYLFADYNDFRRMHWKCSEDLDECVRWFGKDQRDRVQRVKLAICEESVSKGRVAFEDTEPAVRFKQLRKLMYQEYFRIVEQDVSRYLDPIYDFLNRSNRIPAWLGISLLTDEEVRSLSTPVGKLISWRDISSTGLGEILENVDKEKLFAVKPELDLSW